MLPRQALKNILLHSSMTSRISDSVLYKRNGMSSSFEKTHSKR